MGSRQDSNIKIILCTIAYRDRLLDYVLDIAADLGFDGVEIWGREPHISEQFDENRVQAVRRMIEERGLARPVLGSYLCFGARNQRMEGRIELQDTLHTARCLGTSLVRVWASNTGSTEATETIWKTTVREIKEACEQAAKLGITFAAEMHSGTLADTGPAAKRLVGEVDCENFRLNYQVAGHLEPQTALQRLQMVLPYVVHMHAQNLTPLSNDGEAALSALGDGSIDQAPLIGQLKEAGYDGCIAVEFSWVEGDGKQEALAADLAYLRSLLGDE